MSSSPDSVSEAASEPAESSRDSSLECPARPSRLAARVELPCPVEERSTGSLQRVWILPEHADWYRGAVGEANLARPRSSTRHVELVQSTRKSTVYRGEIGDGANSRGVYIKEEPYGIVAGLTRLVATSRTRREFRNLLRLHAADVPAVEPIACAEESTGPRFRASVLVTGEFAGAPNLKEWARTAPSPEDVEAVGKALLGFSRQLARLHSARIFVRSLYGKNILVRVGREAAELCLCDVSRMWAWRPNAGSRRLAVFDLGCLGKWAESVYSPRERLRFLRAYLRERGEAGSLREWSERVARKSAFLRHETRAGRLRKKFRRFLNRYELRKYWPF